MRRLTVLSHPFSKGSMVNLLKLSPAIFSFPVPVAGFEPSTLEYQSIVRPLGYQDTEYHKTLFVTICIFFLIG